jgi:MFS transporter, SP family, galactose:H+ symporter
MRWGAIAATAGFVFGYQLAVISGALLFIRDDFDLGAFEQGALVGGLLLAAMVGSLLAGRLADVLGRRRTLLVVAAIFIAGTVLEVVAPSFAVLLAARALVGVGVGAASSTVPLYLSELAPPDARGRLVTLNQLMVTSGILVGYLVDLALSGSGSWRAMFAVGMLPALVLFVGMLQAPESPVWLEARRRSGGQRTEADAWRLLKGSARPALAIGVVLAAAQQFAGINAVIAYSPSIMQSATGGGASSSILYSVVIGAINFAATVVSFRLIDRLGRRTLLTASLIGMFASLLLLGLAFAVPHGAALRWLALTGLVTYVAAFAVGLGPVFWVLIGEIFPDRARAAGASVSSAVNWFSAFVVGFGFLAVADAIGEGLTFWVLAAVCALTLVFTTRYVPETKGRSFGEIEAEIRERFTRAPLGLLTAPWRSS